MIKETDKDIETKKQRILITGGSGFLGINLIRYLIKKGFKDIVVIDIVNLVNYILGSNEFTDSQLCAADLNGDSIINVIDIVNLVNTILN